MVCRVFCRSVKRTSETEEEREFLHKKETEAVAAAALVAALGRSDAEYIHDHLMPGTTLRVRPQASVYLMSWTCLT